jgi:hypothetical protein
MMLLRRLGLPPRHPQALKACSLMLEEGLHRDGGINFSFSYRYSETCVTGMVLSLLAYFRLPDERIHRLAEHLLGRQMPDGGWNCQSYRGATHGSVHTTISVLEGLLEYERAFQRDLKEVRGAQTAGREFLLCHRMYKSDRTGRPIKPQFTRLSFPPRWHYDILRGLDHFRDAGAEPDERAGDAIKVLKKKEKRGRWPLQNRHPGRTHFEMEKPGGPSRWNTLRALRVLKWWGE